MKSQLCTDEVDLSSLEHKCTSKEHHSWYKQKSAMMKWKLSVTEYLVGWWKYFKKGQRQRQSWGHSLWLHLTSAIISDSMAMEPVVSANYPMPLGRYHSQVPTVCLPQVSPSTHYIDQPKYGGWTAGRTVHWLPRTQTQAHRFVVSHPNHYTMDAPEESFQAF